MPPWRSKRFSLARSHPTSPGKPGARRPVDQENLRNEPLGPILWPPHADRLIHHRSGRHRPGPAPSAQRALSTQRTQGRLEIAADRVISSLERRCDALRRNIAPATGAPPDGAVVMDAECLAIGTRPSHGLFFYRRIPETGSFPAGTFAAAKVEVKMNRPGLYVQTRQGYFAPNTDPKRK